MQATVSRVRDLGEAFHYASLAADRAGGGLRGFQAGVSTFVGGTSAIKGAASGLLGVMGGPWGLAFTGAATVLGAWMQKQCPPAGRRPVRIAGPPNRIVRDDHLDAERPKGLGLANSSHDG